MEFTAKTCTHTFIIMLLLGNCIDRPNYPWTFSFYSKCIAKQRQQTPKIKQTKNPGPTHPGIDLLWFLSTFFV